MNLADSLGVQTPKLVSFKHLPMQTDNVGNPIGSITATKLMYQDGIRRSAVRVVRTTLTGGNVETLSENF